MMSRHDSIAWLIAAFLLGTTVLYTRVCGRSAAPTLDASLTFFPLKLREWSCAPIDVNEASYRDGAADYSWVGQCLKAETGLALEVHIGYASGANFRSRNLSPRLNHPGPSLDDRWSFIPRNQASKPGQLLDSTRPSWNLLLLKHSTGPRLAVLYWYQVGDSIYSDDYRYRMALLVRRLLRRPAASQLIRISTTVRAEDDGSAFDATRELAELLAPVVRSRFSQ